MRVAIAGGALQGLELAYLAKKAGFETYLLDQRSDAPATGICDRFDVVDLTDHEALSRHLGSVDLVLPATENSEALQSLFEWCEENGMPLAFDPGAYATTSSKIASDALFRKMGIPAPAPWPDCRFPVLAKPDGESGSRDVEVFSDLPALEARFGVLPPPGHVLQEYLSGPSYSIEVMGRADNYTPIQITDLEMDSGYDCKRVLAPSRLPPHLIDLFEDMAVDLAEAVGLTGIMDVEVICVGDKLLVLEIDARFPSQTPIAVYHSSGINMVEGIAKIFATEELPQPGPFQDLRVEPIPRTDRPARGAIVEHVRVREGQLGVRGEHVMAEHGPLHLETDFFGADEALTNHSPERHDWVATLIVGGTDLEEAQQRRDQVIREIRDRFNLRIYRDESPEERLEQVS